MPDLPLVGTDFAGYRLRSVLGRGGMSVVYQAENPRLLNLIALKVLAPDLASDEVFRTRFREESQIAASLNHPNVIPIHDFGSCDGLLYIAMRYVSGTDLRRLIADHGWLPPEAAVYLLEQAARALDAAHARELVHRDVKPGNLLIAQSNEDGDPDHVYLADFGITKHIGGRTGLTIAGTVLGTVHYVSPEQIQDQPVFGAADQYSLGCVLYECLTGRAPFEKSSNEAIMWAHVHEQPAAPTMLRPDLPPAIDEVIARVLAKNPGDRYASCREFIADARNAIAPSRSFQAAPVPSSQSRPPVQPTVTDQGYADQRYPDQRYSAALSGPRASGESPAGRPTSGWPSSGGPTDPWAAQTPSGPTDHGDQFAFAHEPVRRRPVRRRRRRGEGAGARSALSLIAIGASAAVIAGGGAAAGVLIAKTGNTTGAGQATHSAPAAGSLLSVLDKTEGYTGRLLMSGCAQQQPTLVQCTNPDPAIQSVTFRTFPSLAAMYTDYEQIIGNLSGKPAGSVENQHVCGDLAPEPTAENTWNHSDGYYTKYSISQMVSGKVSNDVAMGRVFCAQTSSGSEYIVWTQNAGHMLGYATGAAPHHEVWQWFHLVHHYIYFPGMNPMTKMPVSPEPTAGTGTSAAAASMP
jgi:serine/threonine protein kinase